MEAIDRVNLGQFAEDVASGLGSSPKTLSSRYFYDEEGSRLFTKIMELPEYYLTRAELGVLNNHAEQIIDAFSNGERSLHIIELGAGDGSKTSVIIRHTLSRNIRLTYSPIDISETANALLTAKFRKLFPILDIRPLTGDYFKVLDSLVTHGAQRRIFMFLGSNIGNMSKSEAIDFFQRLNSSMGQEDGLFIGFDLQKDPRVILAAYDDSQGVTADFNLNLLKRINRELGGNFDLSKFSHYAIYRPNECAARSFLISRELQRVFIEDLDREFEFEQWEPIFMEISQKYNRSMIAEMAEESGFVIKAEFVDEENFYLNSFWKPAA